jgi:hypothetical protein
MYGGRALFFFGRPLALAPGGPHSSQQSHLESLGTWFFTKKSPVVAAQVPGLSCDGRALRVGGESGVD